MGGYLGPPPREMSYGYGSRGRSGDNVTDLLYRQGMDAAERARQSGEMWSNTFRDVGQALGGAIQQHAAEKEQRKQQEGLAKQDAAFVARMSSGPMMPKDFVQIYGPDRGMKMAQAYGQLQEPKPDIHVVAAGFDAQSDPMKAHSYPQVRASITAAHPELGEVMPEQFDPEWWGKMRQQLTGQGGPAAPVKVGAGESLVDPATGKPVYSAPTAPQKPGAPHVVNGALVDDSGKVIYRDPNAGRDNEPLVAIMDPKSGESVLVPRSRAVGMRPASNREQGRPLPAGSAETIANFNSGLDELNALTGALGEHGSGATAKIGSWIPNFITEWTGLGADSKSKQAVIDRVKQVVGKTLEDGVLRKEDEAKYEKILPTISDPPDVAAAKLDGLWSMISQKQSTFADAMGDSGYDMSRFNARPTRQRQAPAAPGGAPTRPKAPVSIKTDADYNALPSGSEFIAPDGSHRVKP